MRFNVNDFIKTVTQPDISKKMPVDEYAVRISRLRLEMDKKGIAAAFAYGNEYKPGDTGWLTGYDPHIEDAIVIVGKNNVIVLGSPDARSYAVEMIKVGEFRCLAGSGIPDAEYPGYNWITLEDALEEACGRVPQNVGVLSSYDLLPAQYKDRLYSAFDGRLIGLNRWMMDSRYHKSEREMEMLRIAAEITSRGMEAAVTSVEPGVTELQVAANAEFVMKWLGSDRFGFTTIVMSGPRASVNIGRATDRTIEDGDFVIVGASARYEGLNSALGRTIVAGGKPSDGQKNILEHGARALGLAIEKLKPGVCARDVDLASRNYLASVGLRQFYNIGHGIGWTECFEDRIVSRNSEYTFPRGIAVQIDVSVAPDSYYGMDPRRVGLRLEDPFIINHDGVTERLTDLPLEIW